MIHLLFVYGTLLRKENPFGEYLLKQSKHIGLGKFRGRLFDIGEYPGAIYDPESNTYVHGSIVSLDNIEETFKILDDYEGFGEDQQQPNEFIRKLVEIECNYESVNCWVYLYNLPVNELLCIDSGIYK